MNNKIAYDVYRGTSDRTLRLATMPGAGRPAHVKRKDWVLMPAAKLRCTRTSIGMSAHVAIASSSWSTTERQDEKGKANQVS
jgi:transcriptional regulator with XRE-family HTH domain